ncbi:MAG: hypothetical protein AB7E96_06605 [Deferribacterales bacterium]
MSFEKLKMLTAMDYLKVSLPLAALLGVFFMKPVLESYLDSTYRDKLSAVVSSFRLDVEKNDADFIRSLTDKENSYDLRSFRLSLFDNGRFLRLMFNQTAENDIQTEEAAETLSVPLYIPSSVFNGKVKKYAVIGGAIVRPGDVFINGDKVTAIGDGCVLIEGKWGKQWFYVQY